MGGETERRKKRKKGEYIGNPKEQAEGKKQQAQGNKGKVCGARQER